MISIKRKLIFSLEKTIIIADYLIETSKKALDTTYPNYKYQPIDNTEEIDKYVEEEIRKQLIKK